MLQIKDYPEIGERLYTGTLPNGLRLRIVPKPGFHTYYAVFAAHYGGAHRRFSVDGQMTDTPAGVAHYLEHKMFDLPGGDNALNILTANGADPNAFTSSGMTAYYFQCAEHFEDNLRMLLHFVSTPYFTPETVQKEQGIIAQEIQMGDDTPGNAIFHNLLRQLYAHHPIRDKVIGTVESIAQITDQTLYDCHKAFYTPSNMVLCVEGDVDPETILAIAEAELPKECRPVPQADFGEPEDLLPLEKEHRQTMPVSAPQFLIGAKIRHAGKGPAAMRQQIVSMLALRMLLGASSPFYTRLYADGTLNRDFDYDVYLSSGTGTILIDGESADPAKVLAELQAEVARVSEQGFEPASFERAMRSSFGARLRGLEDFDSVCLSMASSAFDDNYAFDSLAMMQTVTKEECEDFIRENLAPERLAISLIEPPRS